MELETVNKLFLELSQFSTAITGRELQLKELLKKAKAEFVFSNKFYTSSDKDILIKELEEILK